MASWNVSLAPGTPTGSLTQLQLSYSTADIEAVVFFGERNAEPERTLASGPQPAAEEQSAGQVVVIGNELFQVEESEYPGDYVRLTPESGLLHLAEAE